MTPRQEVMKALEALGAHCEKNHNKPLWPNGPTGEQYWVGMSRRDPDTMAPRGSWIDTVTSAAHLYELFKTLEWEKISPKREVTMEGHSYYMADLRSVGANAWNMVVPLHEALSNGLTVNVKGGSHGWELIADPSKAHPDGFLTGFIVAIVDDRAGMLATWHPGMPLLPLPQSIRDVVTIDPNWGVKLTSYVDDEDV